MGVSQNNIRNNQNFNICNSIRRHCSTNNIKRNVEPGGSTLSRSIFAFLENRDNTNVDSNPTKTSMNLKNSAQGKFSNWPNASPLAAWRLRTHGNRQSEGRAGRTQEGCKSTRRANDSRTGNSASNTNIAGPDGRSPARFSSALCLAPPPPAALLSQHHSHFLASPVGYLYERGDR